MATPTLRGARMYHSYHVAVEALCRASIVCAEDVCDRIRQAIRLCGGSHVANALVKLCEPKYGE